MTDSDRTLDDALRAEERALLRSIGEEPGYLDQALAIFGGRTGWTSVVLMIVQALAFVGGVWAAWNFFRADETLAALRWGLPAAVLLLMSLIIKMALWPTIHSHRLLRELKRLELMISRPREG